MIQKINATAAKVWLIGFSLWFYGYFNIRYLCIMLFSIVINYGIYMLLNWKKQYSNYILAGGVILNLGILFYFKYYDFFIVNINDLLKASFPLKHILLPLGISFFTFQQISFLADTYRGELDRCSFIDYALFVSFFPQLIAGPIVTHEEMLPQFDKIGKRRLDLEQFARGLFIFALGLSKKVLIADTFGIAVDTGYSSIGALKSLDSLLIMLFYTLQLYFDFSGYCDMAIGIGQMLGIRIPVNFNSPYKAVNIIDFWKRWHITLSRFFTKNIYIPLGGNRKGVARMYMNLLLIFFISGLWHGAGWKFVVWGMLHGVLYCITRAYQRWKKNHKCSGENSENRFLNTMKRAICVAATFIYVNFAWIFFRANSISDSVKIIKRIFIGGLARPIDGIIEAFNLNEFWYILKILHLTNFTFSREILMIVFTIFALIIVFFTKNASQLGTKWKPTLLNAFITSFLLIWCIVSLSGVSTFLYFNF